jgi:hypothetical protein
MNYCTHVSIWRGQDFSEDDKARWQFTGGRLAHDSDLLDLAP